MHRYVGPRGLEVGAGPVRNEVERKAQVRKMATADEEGNASSRALGVTRANDIALRARSQD